MLLLLIIWMKYFDFFLKPTIFCFVFLHLTILVQLIFRLTAILKSFMIHYLLEVYLYFCMSYFIYDRFDYDLLDNCMRLLAVYHLKHIHEIILLDF